MKGSPQKFGLKMALFYHLTAAWLSCLQHSVDFKMIDIADQTEVFQLIQISVYA